VTEFVHLHVHTQFSLLDGAVKVKDLIKRTAAAKQRAVALTDHNNMHGAVGFYKAAREAGVQPILGCEIGHFPLLASTIEGYKNLLWLASHATHPPPLETPEARTHADYLLEKLNGRTKGLIGLTGCMGGLLAQRILYEGEHQGNLLLGQLRECFDPGALYMELQDHGLPEQPHLNGILHDLSIQHGLRKVATNDVHYAERSDADAHLVLGCIKSQRPLVVARQDHHGSSEMYLKSGDEMAEIFTPPTLATTLEIAEKCSSLKLDLGKPLLPTFPVPEGETAESYFRHLAWKGLRGRGLGGEVYEKRLAFELDVIAKMNFPGYFLIVWDFIRYAKECGIPVGPGRGSGAGSIVAYALRITDIDPIQHGLLFERFLNPDRVSMPDFDIDFCMLRRDEVVAYVRQKYGAESVGQIATFMELKARSVLKDVARALGISPMEAQKIVNLIPPGSQTHTTTITESLELEHKLGAPEYREVVGYAQKLEGLTRHVGMHAAGLVISEGPLWNYVPVFQADGHGEKHYVSQFAMNEV
jgi:DNA polymerase-3 subunit alpha